MLLLLLLSSLVSPLCVTLRTCCCCPQKTSQMLLLISHPAELKTPGEGGGGRPRSERATQTNKHTEKMFTCIFHSPFPFPSVLPSAPPSLGYQISYRLDSRDPQRWTTVEVGSNARQFTVTGLLPEQTYVFKLVSRTAVGWGQEKEAMVVTTERRGKGHVRAFSAFFFFFLSYDRYLPSRQSPLNTAPHETGSEPSSPMRFPDVQQQPCPRPSPPSCSARIPLDGP